MPNKHNDAQSRGTLPELAAPVCSEVDQLRRALKETTDAMVHAFCWEGGNDITDECERGRWDGVRALAESNGELLSTGAAWLYESSPNAKCSREAAATPKTEE